MWVCGGCEVEGCGGGGVWGWRGAEVCEGG